MGISHSVSNIVGIHDCFFSDGSKDEKTDMQPDQCKLHLVKKKGMWATVDNVDKLILPQSKSLSQSQLLQSESSLLPQTKNDINVSYSSHYTINQSMDPKQANSRKHWHKKRKRHKHNHKISKSHSQDVPMSNLSFDHSYSVSVLNSNHNNRDLLRSRNTFTRTLSTSEITAELETTPNYKEIIRSRTPSPSQSGINFPTSQHKGIRTSLSLDSLPTTIGTLVSVFQKPIRSNTKENSPVKDNKLKQVDDHDIYAGLMKSTSFGTDAALKENAVSVSSCKLPGSLNDKSRNMFTSFNEVDTGISTLTNKSFPVDLQFQADYSTKTGTNEQDSFVNLEIRDNVDLYTHTEYDTSILSRNNFCQVTSSTSTFEELPTELKTYNIRETLIKNLKTSQISSATAYSPVTLKMQKFATSEINQGTFSVDELLKNGEVQMETPLHNSPACNYIALPTHIEKMASNNYDQSETDIEHYSSSAEPNRKRHCNPDRKSLRTYSKIQEVNNIFTTDCTDITSTRGCINIDQLYQDLTGVPMVQLEKLSVKTLKKYYGINIQGQ